jgi:hypothetical protein
MNLIARDKHRILHFDQIMADVAQKSAIAAITNYQKSKDNIDDGKERQTAKPVEVTIGQQGADDFIKSARMY